MHSNLNVFKIGVGPSSSHTLGPMLAAKDFCNKIIKKLHAITSIEITLYGSLSLTGRGHLSDSAVIWGLSGLEVLNLTKDIQKECLNRARQDRVLNLCGKKLIDFNPILDIGFSHEFLKEHENALTIKAYSASKDLIEEQTYFSVGGGFIKTKEQMLEKKESLVDNNLFEIKNATCALDLCKKHNINLCELSLKYELQFHSQDEIYSYLKKVYSVMQDVYNEGINTKELYLPGPLKLKRRAPTLLQNLKQSDDPLAIIDNISLYAIAIAEENASGGRVVTAPTNGACAVIPAVMLYLKNHTKGFDDKKACDFLLTAMLIGSFYIQNASISGAEAGCQAEIGSASSMAAAAMATVMGANCERACNAAEIAMEHHLGLTCDPVYGLVQIPCIERNAFGAIKAISAARMAIARKDNQKVNLDEVIATMYKTGKDMSYKYKETAQGGLAAIVN